MSDEFISANIDDFEQSDLTEAKYGELERNTYTFVPKTKKRQHAKTGIQIKSVSYVPYSESGEFEVKSSCASSGNTYNMTMMFKDVDYLDDGDSGGVPITTSGSDSVTISPLSVNKNDVKVRCDCLDFKWRFAYHNNKHSALYGDPPEPYTKKTNRPPNNPFGVSAVCKHILVLYDYLSNLGIIKR